MGALKAMKMWEYYQKISKGGKTSEIAYRGKELISVNRKVTGGFKQLGRKSLSSVEGRAGKKPIGGAVPRAGGKVDLIAGAPPKAGGLDALVAGLPPKAGGLEALDAEAPPKDGGPGAMITGSPPKGVPEGAAMGLAGSLAVLMAG